MNTYEKYVEAVNKLFELLDLMKKEIPNQDNLNYISSLEGYKDTLVNISEIIKGTQNVQKKVEALGND